MMSEYRIREIHLCLWGVTQFNDNLWKPDIIERNTLTLRKLAMFTVNGFSFLDSLGFVMIE